MKYITFLLAFFGIFVMNKSLFAQVNNGAENMKKNRVKTVYIYKTVLEQDRITAPRHLCMIDYYDLKGNLIGSRFINEDSTYITTKVHVFENNHKIIDSTINVSRHYIEECNTLAEETLDSMLQTKTPHKQIVGDFEYETSIDVINYAYDANGNLIKSDSHLDNHSIHEHTVFEYKNNVICGSKFYEGKEKLNNNYQKKYDEKGRLIESIYLVNNGIQSKAVYTYGENNRLEKYYSYFNSMTGVEESTSTYYYDNANNLIKLSVTNPKNQLIEQTDYTIKGTLTQRYETQSFTKKSKTVMEYVYEFYK